jgi:hypothetical protein
MEKLIAIVIRGAVVKTMSLRDLWALPMQDGYYQLAIASSVAQKYHP